VFYLQYTSFPLSLLLITQNAQSSAVAPVADPVESIEAEEQVRVEKRRGEE
jgi:hypothetical protein